MDPLKTILKKAARRTRLASTLRWTGRGVLIGACVGLLLLALDRTLDLQLARWLYAVVVGSAVLPLTIAGLVRQPERAALAVHLDRWYGLKDRFGTAVRLDDRQANPGAMAALVERDAQTFAARLDVRAATPIRVGGIWGGGLLAVLALWIGVLYVPSLKRPAAIPNEVARVEQLEQRDELARSIESTITEFNDLDAPPDIQTVEQIDALERLADQLAAADPSEPEYEGLRDESARRMTDVADQLAEDARSDQAAADQLAERFAGLEAVREATAGQAEPQPEFSEALRTGDFGKAADSIERLAEEAESLDPDARRALAEHLRKLAEQTQIPDESAGRHLNEQAEQLRQALRDQGMTDEDIEAMLGDPGEGPPQASSSSTPSSSPRPEELIERGAGRESAESLARDISEWREQQALHDATEQTSADLAERMNEAAATLDPQPPADEPTSEDHQPPQDASEQDPPGQIEPTTPNDPSESPTDADRPSSPGSEPADGRPSTDDDTETASDEAPRSNQATGGDENGASSPPDQAETRKPGQPTSETGEQPAGGDDPPKDAGEKSQSGSQSSPDSSDQKPTESVNQASDAKDTPRREQAGGEQDGAQGAEQRREQTTTDESNQPDSRTDRSETEESSQETTGASPPTTDQSPPIQDDEERQSGEGPTPGKEADSNKPDAGKPGSDTESQDPDAPKEGSDQPSADRLSDMLDNLPEDWAEKLPGLLEKMPELADKLPKNLPEKIPPGLIEKLPELLDKLPEETLRKMMDAIEEQHRKDSENPNEPEQDQEPQTPPEMPDIDPETLRRLAEKFRQFENQRDGAESQREISERMRDRAREMADRMSPEERQKWAEQWRQEAGDSTEPDASPTEMPQTGERGDPGERHAEQPSPSSGDGKPQRDEATASSQSTPEDAAQPGGSASSPDASPGRLSGRDRTAPGGTSSQPESTETVDVGGSDATDEIIAEWMTELEIDLERPDVTRTARRPDRVRTAQRIAERAVDESVVPERYHRLIKRYFDQLAASAKSAAKNEGDTKTGAEGKTGTTDSTSEDSPAGTSSDTAPSKPKSSTGEDD